MTDLPKAALYGYDSRTSGAWLWFAENLDFEVVAVAAPGHEIESVRRLAADLEAPLYSSLEALFEEARFDVLLVTQPLEEARRATGYGLDRGVRVHTEIVPATIRRSTGAIAAFGIDLGDTGALITVGGRHRLEHLALADYDREQVRDLARELGATAHGSLPEMVEAGGFAELYLASPWSLAQEAIHYLSERGIRVIGDFLPEAGSPATESGPTRPAVTTGERRIGAVSRVALLAGTEQRSELAIRRIVRALGSSSGYPVAFVDDDFARAWRIGDDFAIPTFLTMAEAIRRTEPDGVVLAVPPAPHARSIVHALERGLDVICPVTRRRRAPSAAAPVGHAVLGCGDEVTADRVRSIAGALSGQGGAVVAVADHDLEAASALAGELGVPALGTIEEVIARPEVDALLVVGAPASYEDAIVTALEHGLPVFRGRGLRGPGAGSV